MCAFASSLIGDLSKHIGTLHENKHDTTKCEGCDYKSVKVINIKDHMTKNHDNKVYEIVMNVK